ncbi:hypothetical protein ACVMB3_004164 [Sinorhizobium meliloti]
MKNALIAATLSTMALVDAPAARSESITVNPVGAAASVLADAKNFTGHVVVDMLLPSSLSTPASSGLVTFAPGARTAWHSHPLGQMLIVTAGKGWVQLQITAQHKCSSTQIIRCKTLSLGTIALCCMKAT